MEEDTLLHTHTHTHKSVASVPLTCQIHAAKYVLTFGKCSCIDGFSFALKPFLYYSDYSGSGKK